ncbi:hypothetical protein E3E36_03625 [Thermococcus sp. M36]|uniref:prenyltransferase/squalene oxidase repeat-containing protein n=1 Tax=Thermococcus sp. M36 TaxID=1638261 RepID=UPI001438A576|nr:prenyltransferase/squalene oxidase repeat-containing protein [Thermococcus sp. M36]NJE05247.1 hypothetical protein [Thermococcus sp. M36]
MRRVLLVIFAIMLIGSSLPLGTAKIEPYVYRPTVPDTAFAVLALYRTGDYGEVLEGCEWLMAVRTPLGSWGMAYGEEHSAKYTAMAMLALMRGENIAHGRYSETLNNAAYWLIYKQNADGSWEDYTGTALALVALREFLEGGHINPGLTGFEKQVKEAIDRATGWLMGTEPKTETERIFGYMALGRADDLERMEVSGELKAYRAFALAYLGREVELDGDFQSTVSVAMALYATGEEKYRGELLRREHFGFWGTLHYRVLDLLSVSKVEGFEDLKAIACPYVDKIQPRDEWEKAALADYHLTCGKKPELPENLSELLPWQVAEVARVKAELGQDYGDEIGYLLSTEKNGVWRDFYNTEYVIWVFKQLNVSYDYGASLEYLSKNLTWMISAKDPKTGNPVYYNTPTYYFAYALLVFKEFGMEKELDETLEILKKRQYPNGAFPYTQGSVAGITSTAKAAWALQEAGLTGTELYSKAVSFLRELLYADIPELEEKDGRVKLENATFLFVKGSEYTGNSTDTAETTGLDGYVVMYPVNNPLVIEAHAVNGFVASGLEGGSEKSAYIYIGVGVVLIALAVVAVGKGWKRKNKRK